MPPVYSVGMKEDSESLLLMGMGIWLKKKNKRKHRWWVNEILQKRQNHGVYYHLVAELQLNEEQFKRYFRLSREQFKQVLFLVESSIFKLSMTREAINPRQRLSICLRYLATGESFRSLAYSYRVGEQTVGKIVPEVCRVIWDKLSPIVMKMPTTHDDWRLIAENFLDSWNFPNCVGAIDGKHVVMRAPGNSGSLYFNYKGTFSMVLLALVDAQYRFIYIDVGSYGRNSDGGIFSHSTLGQKFRNGELNLPPERVLAGAEHLGPLPYVFVGDEAFPLTENLMRPFPGRGCPLDQQFFNYRLSRARRVVENGFGILAARWRVFHSKISINPRATIAVIKAACALHNMLQRESTPAQISTLLQDYEIDQNEGLLPFHGRGNHATNYATEIRQRFKEYFIKISPLSWQNAYVQRGCFDKVPL